MKLSIITINYNNAANLERTINSVIEQTWTGYEYIIIDGGSADGSLEVIMKYKHFLSYWVSEADNGIYHAMNKGVKKASGEYLLMLNAGDVLYNKNVLQKVFQEYGLNEDIIYGDVLRESNGKVFTESLFPDKLTFFFFRSGAICHQAAFIRRKLHDIVGLYDERLKFCSDWSFILLAICKYDASYKHIKYKISVCNADGVTCSPANAFIITKERQHVLSARFSAFVDDYELLDNIKNGGIYNRLNTKAIQLITKCKAFVKAVSSF